RRGRRAGSRAPAVGQGPLPAAPAWRRQAPQAGLLPGGVLLALLPREPRLLRTQAPGGKAAPSGAPRARPPSRERPVGHAARSSTNAGVSVKPQHLISFTKVFAVY